MLTSVDSWPQPDGAQEMPEAGIPLLRALLQISRAVQQANYFDEALEVIAGQSLLALNAASLSISRWERDDDVLRTLINVGDLGPGEERWPENELYPVTDDRHVSQLLQHGQAYINSVDDVDVDPAAVAMLHQVGKQSELAVAVMYDGRMWGELWATGFGGRRFGPEDVQLLQAIAAHVSVAIGRTALFSTVWRYAYQDPLTGLANLRGLDARFAEMDWQHSRPVILICDVDHFKDINDRDGHPAGDAILRGIANVLTETSSTTTDSMVARLGGDEFCVVLPRTSTGDAEVFARNAGRVILHEVGADVSLSWGVAAFGSHSDPARELMKAADEAMLAAKRLGPGRFSYGLVDTEGLLGGNDRRRTRDAAARPASDDLVPNVVRLLDEHRPQTVAAAMEILIGQVCNILDVAGWCISVVTNDALRTERGIHTLRDRPSGLRVVEPAQNIAYPLADYPATVEAIAEGSAFVAGVDLEGSDPAETALLAELGYRAVLAVGVADGPRGYLLEFYSDEGHAELTAIAPHVRVLAHYCTRGLAVES